MKAKIFAVILIAVICSMVFVGCTPPADKYTEEEHIQRVSKRVEKRYMQEGSEFTGYEVFPLYDANDELKYILVELEPYGFVYIRINKNSVKSVLSNGMYWRHHLEGYEWQRYTIVDGERVYETDENGEEIKYKDSHFKVAGVENEKRYLLLATIYDDYGGNDTRHVPAVKRGDKFLNLVSMEEFDIESLEHATKDQVVSNIDWHFPQRKL